jgi:hypothetical protein
MTARIFPRYLTAYVAGAVLCSSLTVCLAEVPKNLQRPDDRVPLSPAAMADLKKLDRPITLRGDFLKAVNVAWEDFFLRKSKELKEARNRANFDPANSEMLDYLSKMESYDIQVKKTDTQIVVYIGNTLRDNAPIIFGGDARYWIDNKEFTISKKEFYK